MSFAPAAEGGEDRCSWPILIYDDMCSSCTKFANTAAKLSRGWIRIEGHYKSQYAIDLKKAIFPNNYDSTKMFWLVNRKGAYGARAGLVQTLKEIVIGNFKWFRNGHNKSWYKENNKHTKAVLKDNKKILKAQCNYNSKSCTSTKTTLNRLFNMLKNSTKFTF